jgi:hypothetical protein
VVGRMDAHGKPLRGLTKPDFEPELLHPSGEPLPPGAIFISPGGDEDVILPRELAV